MSHDDVHPTTIEGIKRLGKELKKAGGIRHGEALDLAARRGGFENFRHAQNARKASTSPQPMLTHAVFLSAYWRDDEKGEKGRETLQIRLGRPLRNLAWRGKRTGPYQLRYFRIDADDHLETLDDIVSQDVARMLVSEAARVLHFLDASDLIGSTSRWSNRIPQLPHQDHTYQWVHAPTGAEIVADEPYLDRWLLDERKEWGADKGLHFAMTDVRLYDRGTEPMFFASYSQEALDAICAAIAGRKQDLLPAKRWVGESAPYDPVFKSPALLAKGTRKRSRPKPIDLTKPRNNALPYLLTPLSQEMSWRPANAMPLEVHEEVGRLINALIDLSGYPSGLSRIRYMIDSWLGCEINSAEALGCSTTKLYWGVHNAKLPEGMTTDSAFNRIEELLRAHYPDSKPLRSILRMIETQRGRLARKLEKASERRSNATA